MSGEPCIPYEQLFPVVSPAQVSGESLVADSAYRDLLRDAKGTPEKTNTLPAPPGSATPFVTQVEPAEDPIWEKVRDDAAAILGRSHDFVAAAWYCVGLLQCSGLSGLADGLGAIRWMIEQRWATFHPQLVPDNPSPAFRRIRAMGELAVPPGAREEYGLQVVKRVLKAPLVVARNVGEYSLSSIRMAGGLLPVPPGVEAPQMGRIDAAWRDADLAQLEQTHKDIRASIDHLAGMTSAVSRLGGLTAEQAPSVKALVEVLTDADKHVVQAISRKKLAGEIATPGPAEAVPAHVDRPPANVDGAARTDEPRPAAIPTRAASAADVRKMLDAALAYYEHDEERRASPVPLFLSVAKNLMSKRYTELCKQLDEKTIKTITEWAKPEQSSSGGSI